MAVATATKGGVVTGFDFSNDNDPNTYADNNNTRGSGYAYAPQVIISVGWRKVGVSNVATHGNVFIADEEILEATEGIVIIRKNSSGILTYLKPKNPSIIYFIPIIEFYFTVTVQDYLSPLFEVKDMGIFP